MKNFKFIKPYPLFKVEYEEVPSKYGGKSGVYRIYVKIAEPVNWVLLYVTHTLGWAQIALSRLKEIFDTWVVKFIVEDELPSMFEVNGEVYKTQYVFPEQSCICGEQIAGNKRYAEFAVDYLKFDYVVDTVFFYDKGTCLVKANQLFIDGELIADSTQLNDICNSIGQEMYKLDSDPEKMIKYIQANFKNVNRYDCNGYTSFFNKEVSDG